MGGINSNLCHKTRNDRIMNTYSKISKNKVLGLISLLTLLLINTGCLTPEEQRARDKIQLDNYLSQKPFQCAVSVGNPKLKVLSYMVASLNGVYHEQLMYFRNAVDNHAIYQATIQNVRTCQEQQGKTQQEAMDIVWKRMQEMDASLPESQKTIPRYLVALEAAKHVNEATFYSEFKQFYNPFTFSHRFLSLHRLDQVNNAIAQGKRIYIPYSDLLRVFALVSPAECQELDNALNSVFHGESSLYPCLPQTVEYIRSVLHTNPTEIQQSFQQINADEVQASVCAESLHLYAMALLRAQENRREREEVKKDKHGNEKTDKYGNVKMQTVVYYKKHPLPKEIADNLIALYVIEMQLDSIGETFTNTEKIEKAKQEADRSLDYL